MSQYFKLEELLSSKVAKQKGIENLPSWTVVEHLKELAEFLDGIRSAWGSAIKVSSGFRNYLLNDAVGGVYNSAHLIGYAADVVPANGKFDEFVEFLKTWSYGKKFDQIIIESKGNSKWVHIGLWNNLHQQRHKIFNITKFA